MAKAFDNLTYTMPGANSIALDKRLADKIKSGFAAERENRFQLCLIAAGIRKQSLNSKGHYSSEFEEWWKKNNLTDVYGGQSNFTKHAMAGEVIHHTASMENGERYVSCLPKSLSALYAIHAILKDPQAEKKNWMKICLNHYQFLELHNGKAVAVNDKRTVPLINPDATAPQIRGWYENRKNPPERATKNKKEDKSLALAKISVSGSLYTFNQKTGEHFGAVNIDDLQGFMTELTKLISKYGRGFTLESNLSELEAGYKKRKETADPASGLFSKPTKSRSG